MKEKAIVLILTAVLGFATAFSADSAKKPASKPLPESTILVNVDGKDITLRDLNRYTGMMKILMKNRKPKVTAKELAKFGRSNQKSFSDALMRRAVITSALAPSNLVATAEIRAKKERLFERSYGRKGQKFADIRELAVKGGYGKELDEAFNFDLLLQTYIDTVASNEFYATEVDLATTRQNLEAYNKIAQATNDLNRATAERVLVLARQPGANFAELADKWSQDPDKEPGGSLGDCDESDFLNEESVWRKINSLKPGEVTDVLDLEDGMAIFHLDHRNSAEASDTGAPSLTLSRIFFRLAYLYPEQTDDELMSDITKEKTEAAMTRMFVELRKGRQVTYPNGKISVQK